MTNTDIARLRETSLVPQDANVSEGEHGLSFTFPKTKLTCVIESGVVEIIDSRKSKHGLLDIYAITWLCSYALAKLGWIPAIWYWILFAFGVPVVAFFALSRVRPGVKRIHLLPDEVVIADGELESFDDRTRFVVKPFKGSFAVHLEHPSYETVLFAGLVQSAADELSNWMNATARHLKP